MDEMAKELSWICERYHMTRPDAIEFLKLQVLRKIESDLSMIEFGLEEVTDGAGSDQEGQENFNRLMEKFCGNK